MNVNLTEKEIWFITGSQHLYGDEVLQTVQSHSIDVISHLNQHSYINCSIVDKGILTSQDSITQLIKEANYSKRCIGLIAWMHTFSPAKMWINGLRILQKPLLHFHTQYNADIPWSTIDMDFMNLNQSAHGGREFGFITKRMNIPRKVVVGHWKNPATAIEISNWTRAALGWADSQNMKIARFGDNMRDVAVTEGNKVSAQIQFGYSVNGFGLGDLVQYVDAAADADINNLLSEYKERYTLATSLLADGKQHASLIEAARIELGLKSFLSDKACTAFTTNFENLHGLSQLPGLAVQRLMAEGYGFAAEGDWKTAALVRTMKVMAQGLPGGNSFMEDYTYHFAAGQELVLGSHMLEICPSIAKSEIRCEIHPLSIGGKNDPVRLVFNGGATSALNVCLLDMGDHFSLLANQVEAKTVQEEMPNLPVASVVWSPKPDLASAARSWILAGGAHHTCYSENISIEILKDFSDMANVALEHIS